MSKKVKLEDRYSPSMKQNKMPWFWAIDRMKGNPFHLDHDMGLTKKKKW